MAGLPLFRTLTSRVMTLMMATIIIMSTVLGASIYYSMTAWQAEAALESLLALAAARQGSPDPWTIATFDLYWTLSELP